MNAQDQILTLQKHRIEVHLYIGIYTDTRTIITHAMSLDYLFLIRCMGKTVYNYIKNNFKGKNSMTK